MRYATLARKESDAQASRNKAAPSSVSGGLRISDPTDAHEQEADRVAHEVIAGGAAKRQWSLPSPGGGTSLQRKCSCGTSSGSGGECEVCKQEKEDKMLQRKAAGPAESGVAPPIVHEVLSSPGQPLDAQTRSFFEQGFGHDFSKVRVHLDEKAAESAQALDARAYTFQDNVVFAQGEYRPNSMPGRQLLGHELTHILEGAQGIARDKDPTEHPEPDFIRAPELKIGGVGKALAFNPKLRPHVPQAPSGTASWSTRLRMALGMPDVERKKTLLDLMNEALAPDAVRYPDLHLPVKPFVSDKAARHGDVLLDPRGIPGGVGLEADTRPSDDKLTQPPRIFIVMTPVAMDPNEGPVFTQAALNHEYVHFQQKLNRQLMVRPNCKGVWKGQQIGGNPNREVLAIATTFTRFFGPWADQSQPGTPPIPRNLTTDLALLQAYFPCVEKDIRQDVLSRIADTVTGKPARHQLLTRMIVGIQGRALPNINLSPEDNAMIQLARAIGTQLGPDPRLPPRPTRPVMGPLFDVNEMLRHHQQDVQQATIKSGEELK